MVDGSFPSILGASIQEDEIDDDAVATNKILDNAVTLAKLAHGTANKAIGFDSGGIPSEIEAGKKVMIEEQLGDAVKTDFEFLTDFDWSIYSEFVIIWQAKFPTPLSTISLQFDELTAGYYSINRRNGAATATNNAASAQIFPTMSSSYLNHGEIHITGGVIGSAYGMCQGDVGQAIQIFSAGNTTALNTIGIIRSIKLICSSAPDANAKFTLYGVKK